MLKLTEKPYLLVGLYGKDFKEVSLLGYERIEIPLSDITITEGVFGSRHMQFTAEFRLSEWFGCAGYQVHGYLIFGNNEFLGISIGDIFTVPRGAGDLTLNVGVYFHSKEDMDKYIHGRTVLDRYIERKNNA